MPASIRIALDAMGGDHGASVVVPGAALSLDRHPFEVIGVSAPGFYGVAIGDKTDVTVPICSAAIFGKTTLDKRGWWWLGVMGRSKPGMSRGQQKARLGVISPPIFEAALPQEWEPKEQQDFLKGLFEAVSAAVGHSMEMG
jgi:hypothetical protein